MSKFRMSKRKMLDFNDDCNDACNQCPQYHNDSLIEDRTILLGEINPKKLVKHWLECDTLWTYGYSECLSSNALIVFEEYDKIKNNSAK